MVCCLLSEWCVATSFYKSSANHVFLSTFKFAKLIVPYRIASFIILMSIYLSGISGKTFHKEQKN